MSYKITKWPLMMLSSPKKAEKEIRTALRRTRTVAEAAKKLKINRGHLYRMMEQLGIKLDDVRRPKGAYRVSEKAS